MDMAKQVIRKQLEKETEIAHEQLDKLMNF
jgi:hypothetical protein